MILGEQELAVIAGILGIVGTVATLVARMIWNFLRHKDRTIEELQHQVKQLQTERDGARGERDAAFRERDAALTQKVAVDARLDVATSERDRYKADVQKYVAAFKAEAEKRATADKRAADAEGRLAAADKRAADAEAERDRVRGELTQVRRTNGELVAQGQQLERRLAAEIARREAAERLAGEAEAALNRLRGELEEERTRHEQTRHDLESARLHTEQLTKQVANLEGQIRGYEQQIEMIAQQDGRVWERSIPADVPEFVPLAKRGTSDKPGAPIISVLNLKGGVGKTTITGNLAGFLNIHQQKRVLLIDLDHQRSLSYMLLSPAERQLASRLHTIQRFLRLDRRDGDALFDCSHPIPDLSHCRIVTNADPRDGHCPGLDDVETRLQSEWLVKPDVPDARFLLREALSSPTINEQFDYVLIDCPPRLTTACINALTASDFVLVPCETEMVSLNSLEHIFQRLKRLQDCGLIPHLRALGVVANKVNDAAFAERSPERDYLNQARAALKNIWGAPVHICKTMLRESDYYTRATRFLYHDEPLRLAIHYKVARDDFASLVDELAIRIRYESRSTAKVPA